MPHSRRRKFSVKYNFKGRGGSQLQNAVQVSTTDVNNKPSTPNVDSNQFKFGDQTHQNTSNPVPDRKNDHKSPCTILSTNKYAVITASKGSTANITREHLNKHLETPKPFLIHCDKSFSTSNEDITKENAAECSKQKRREGHRRHHKIKIRSPRRSIVLSDEYSNIVLERSIGTNTEDLKSVFETPNIENVTDVSNIECASSNSIEDMCRICHGGDTFSQELGNLISACSCRGTVARVHVRCLERWLTESGKSRCELCGIPYVTRRVHRYGVPRALVMWIFSQNAKQLMVDTLGIILMSPLAVLAAWLSGRTFSTLLSQENHASPAPWPLASTFVLACMTLVCYYCWVVSAATRHALSWWVWYRAQYEVRLQTHRDVQH